jgi:uncharacterized protein CbrC (UPF0167 family)
MPKPPPPGRPSGDLPLPKFQLFDDPVAAGVFERSADACDRCGRARGWLYTGPVYCEGDEPRICPWCIIEGSAARDAGCTFNDTGVIAHHPGDDRDPPPDEMEQVAERTPGFNSWQGNHWFACCGHAAVFLGEADEADLRGRWAGAVPTILASGKGAFDDAEELIAGLERGGSTGVYVFACRHCGRLGGYFDMD